MSYLFILSSVLTTNFPFLPSPLLLNFPPAENGIAPSSPSPRQQNVALGIKLFDYSVSHRLANLKLSHHAPWTHLWYVCLHIRVCAACVGVCAADCAWLCVRSSLWMSHRLTSVTVTWSPAAFHACVVLSVCVCVSHATYCGFCSQALWWLSGAGSASFILLSQREGELNLQWCPGLLDYQTSN